MIEELHYLEEHQTSNESRLARAAFRRVFKTVTLSWNHDPGRYRELDRAEVEPQHPFALTGNTRIRRRDRLFLFYAPLPASQARWGGREATSGFEPLTN